MQSALFDALPDPVLLVHEGVIVDANRAFRELLGEECVRGLALVALVPDAPEELVEQLTQRATEGGFAARLVFRGRSSQRRIALDVRVSPAGDQGWILVGQDATEVADLHATIGRLSRLYVTRRSAAMVDLDLLLAESRPIFEGLGWNFGLWAIEPLDEETPAAERPAAAGRLGARLRYAFVTSADEAAVATASEMAAMLQGRLFAFDDVPHVAKVVADGRGLFLDNLPPIGAALLRSLGAPGDAEEAMRVAGFVRCALAPVFVDERVAFVLMFSGPRVTERDFAAIQLFGAMVSAAEQLSTFSEEMARQERHAALGQMAAQLAHEVRNPLAVLYQATAQVRRRARDGRDIEELLTMIDEESRRLDRLVNDLVHYAAPLTPRLRETELASIVRYALDGVRAEVPEERFAELQLELDVPELRVRADPVLLRQALAHLFHNAIGHVGQGGSVTISARAEQSWVRLRVTNEGPPLEPSVASRVFEPFFSTKATGLGLGLAVVRRLVEDQGGRVRLEDGQGGVTFAVLLPAI
ncbi:MAG: PAS domain-containing protein [Myxococcales bacterium]|nr:PAS domain-containing protein [Myxococcales bacterium]